MPRSAGPRHADRLTGKILSVLLLFCVLIIPVIAITLVQTAGTPVVIQTTTPVPTPIGTVQTVKTPATVATTTPAPTPVATLQPTQTMKPQTTVTTVKMTTVATLAPTATMVPASPAQTIRQTYTPVMTGSPVIVKTTPLTTRTAAGTPRTTTTVSGPAGTLQGMGTGTPAGGIGGTRPTPSATGPQPAAGGSGAGASPAGDSPALAAAIAGTFNQSRLHHGLLEDVYLTSVGTSRASAAGAGAASAGADLYDADVTAVKKGDLQNNCPDDTIRIRLRGMDPASPVAGKIATGGTQLVFSDPSIRTINIGNGMMTIESLRHVKLFGILDLGYTEVSTISPEGPVKIDRPFWAGLPGAQPQAAVSGTDPCAGPAMGRQGSGITPGVTPTPAPEYQTSEVEITCPCDPVCQPGAYQKCHDDCLSQFSGEYLEFRFGTYCKDRCYVFDYECCFNSCMHNGTDPSRLPDLQYAARETGCNSECREKLLQSILKDAAEDQTDNVFQVTRV
ncbi:MULTISPECIES: hypothetical protein [unclassified Methanoregula]|uniref:hypothetical protein n=1 Tax=unclassified Methanoregula TaxID=2649730 RepID=UPI0009D2B404|nr:MULTISPECIES: hypothetical protein [unclassified Methanoregula]OPX61800.1 MAG: hypothetical protein A4E33_02902 [Methanoregula sp. PtaB.Bin085]OPY33890.1 MAG: hypothetical protein A4E34_01475 [Methanoregula sp. PtaU1.Bin006]